MPSMSEQFSTEEMGSEFRVQGSQFILDLGMPDRNEYVFSPSPARRTLHASDCVQEFCTCLITLAL